MGNETPKNSEATPLAIKMAIQMEVITLFCGKRVRFGEVGFDAYQKMVDDWVKEYSIAFRKLFASRVELQGNKFIERCQNTPHEVAIEIAKAIRSTTVETA